MESANTNTEIYSFITSLVIDSEFIQMQNAFFDKHMGQFTVEEENKLEYTTIFEQYQQVMDQIIDAKCKEKFSEASIDAFYEGFKSKVDEYASIN